MECTAVSAKLIKGPKQKIFTLLYYQIKQTIKCTETFLDILTSANVLNFSHHQIFLAILCYLEQYLTKISFKKSRLIICFVFNSKFCWVLCNADNNVPKDTEEVTSTLTHSIVKRCVYFQSNCVLFLKRLGICFSELHRSATARQIL